MSMEILLVLLLGSAIVIAREWWLEGSYPNFNKSWSWPRARRPLLGIIVVVLLAIGAHLWQEPGSFVMCSGATCEIRSQVSEQTTTNSVFDKNDKEISTVEANNIFDWRLTVTLAGIVIAILTGIYFAALQNTLNSGKEALRELRNYEKRFRRVIAALQSEKENRNNIDLSVAELLYKAVKANQVIFADPPSKEIAIILTELQWVDKFKNLIDSLRESDVSIANENAMSLIKEIDSRRQRGINFKKSLFHNSLYTTWPILQEYWRKVGGAETLKQYEGLTKLYYSLSQEFGQQDFLEYLD